MHEFQLSSLPLSPSMTESANFCRPMASITNVNIELEMDEMAEQVQVQLNALRFQQIVVNLVSNAIKYTPPHSTVRINAKVLDYGKACELMDDALVVGLPASQRPETAPNTRRDTPVVVVSVSDEGIGVSEEVAYKIFSQFAQVTTQRSSVVGGNSVAQPSGTGLGLNLCVKFIQRMNGNIWVSRQGCGNGRVASGACFSFYLPVVSSGDSRTEEPKHPAIQDAASVSLPRLPHCESIAELRVLVVGDDVLNLSVLGRMLRRMTVARVHTVDSANKVLQMLEQGDESFDLVITGLKLSDMSGTELSDAIRDKIPAARRPVVVGLTADTVEKQMLDKCRASGLLHVLQIPLTNEQLQKFLGGFFTAAREDRKTLAAPPSLPPPSPPPRTTSSRASTLKVLVVDDTIINLKVLNRMLRSIGVARVVTVDSGVKALCALEQEKFDLGKPE